MNRLLTSLLIAGCLLSNVFAQAGGNGRLNYTGLTGCWVKGAWTSSCERTGQDAAYGRDLNKPKASDGRAGFSWQKMGPTGADLPASAPIWICVRDKVTGLTWEVKTDDGGPRDKDNGYTIIDGGIPSFVDQVNQSQLCGRTNWRIPTRGELLGIVDFSLLPGDPFDPQWLPNSPTKATYTSSCLTCGIYHWVFIPFADPAIGNYFVGGWYENPSALRLVSDAAPAYLGERYTIRGGEVLDRVTNLIWRRCSEGTRFREGRCDGQPLALKWSDATKHAVDVADATGKPWRLPNVKELESLLIFDSTYFDEGVFPGLDLVSYWSSTAYNYDAGMAWCVHFSEGPLYPVTGPPWNSNCAFRSRSILVRDNGA